MLDGKLPRGRSFGQLGPQNIAPRLRQLSSLILRKAGVACSAEYDNGPDSPATHPDFASCIVPLETIGDRSDRISGIARSNCVSRLSRACSTTSICRRFERSVLLVRTSPRLPRFSKHPRISLVRLRLLEVYVRSPMPARASHGPTHLARLRVPESTGSDCFPPVGRPPLQRQLQGTRLGWRCRF